MDQVHFYKVIQSNFFGSLPILMSSNAAEVFLLTLSLPQKVTKLFFSTVHSLKLSPYTPICKVKNDQGGARIFILYLFQNENGKSGILIREKAKA